MEITLGADWVEAHKLSYLTRTLHTSNSAEIGSAGRADTEVREQIVGHSNQEDHIIHTDVSVTHWTKSGWGFAVYLEGTLITTKARVFTVTTSSPRM